MKYFWLRGPRQLLIQTQWWSIMRMQRWHTEQWWDRGGLTLWHVGQKYTVPAATTPA